MSNISSSRNSIKTNFSFSSLISMKKIRTFVDKILGNDEDSVELCCSPSSNTKEWYRQEEEILCPTILPLTELNLSQLETKNTIKNNSSYRVSQ